MIQRKTPRQAGRRTVLWRYRQAMILLQGALLRALVLAGALGATAVQAASPPEGADAPEFRAALTLWLKDDEAAALPALAELASAGNPAAQLLLGVINVTPSVQGPWLAQQDRATRIAVLRRPEAEAGPSLSGKSWFSAPADPRAKAWALALRADAPMTVVLDFARLEEPRAAAQAAFRLMSRQRRGFAALAAEPDFPPFLLPYAALESGSSAPLDPADPHRALFGPHVLDLEAQSNWIAANADPVVAFCAETCPTESAPICRAAALAALGGVTGLLHTGSPVEALVPSQAFNRSAKGLSMVRALMTRENLASSSVESQCLTKALN